MSIEERIAKDFYEYGHPGKDWADVSKESRRNCVSKAQAIIRDSEFVKEERQAVAAALIEHAVLHEHESDPLNANDTWVTGFKEREWGRIITVLEKGDWPWEDNTQ